MRRSDELPAPDATSLTDDEVAALREWASHAERTMPEHVVLLCDEVLRLRERLESVRLDNYGRDK